MTTNPSIWTRLMLVAILLCCGVGGVLGAANLTLTKSAEKSMYESGETIKWTVSVTNENTSSEDVNVAEILPEGCTVVGNSTENGTYEQGFWNFTLEGGNTAVLDLFTNCSLSCSPDGTRDLTNEVRIVQPELEEGVADTATAMITVTVPECKNITFRPATLNLKQTGNGVATVFVTVGDQIDRTDIDEKNSSVTCNNASPEKILFSEQDNGTVMLKFRRGEFEFGSVGETVLINCSGSIALKDGSSINLEGQDEVRAVHAESNQASLFQRILQFLGLVPATSEDDETGDDSGADTIETLNPGDLNLGQLKKVIRNQEQVQSGEEDDTAPADPGQGSGGNMKPSEEKDKKKSGSPPETPPGNAKGRQK